METSLPLRQRIQSAIIPIHQEIDFLPLVQRVMSPTVTVLDYRNFLIATYGFIIPLEASLKTEFVLNALAERNIPTKFRQVHIEQDLETLGLTESEIRELPVMKGFLPVTTLAEAMGVLYALEGFRIGALAIARRVLMGLKLDGMAGARFVNPDPSPRHTIESFDLFVKKLDTFADDPKDEMVAISCSVRVFSKVKNWLENYSLTEAEELE